MTGFLRKLSPACFLFLFAPITAEYLSGSSPSFNPIIFLVNLLLYGPGVLMIRELKVKWHKGWLAVFIMSAAYMIAEEGLMLNTLFDPFKNTAGRSLGVNWVWTTGMLLVHSLVSVFLPILLAEALYSGRARHQWIRPRTFFVLLAVFCGNVFGLGRLVAPTNRPGITFYLVELAIIVACVVAAKHAPGPRSGNAEFNCLRSPRWLYFASLIGTTITFIVGFAVPSLPMPALAKMALMAAVYLAFLEFLRRNHVFNPGLAPLAQLAIAAGIVSFWILVTPLTMIGKGNPGPLIFAVLTIAFFVRIRRRLMSLEPPRPGALQN
ncbi:MAG: hypothetical protein ACLQVX_00260 [Limisphaerales bacterium]